MARDRPVKPPSEASARIRPRPKRRGAFHHGDLAEQLAITAVDLVEREGHEHLSLKKVASRLGVTEPALYRHYEGRDDLLAEVAVRGLAAFIAHTEAAADAEDDPFDSIRAYGRAYVRYCAAHPGWFRLTFSRFTIEKLLRLPRAASRLGGSADDRARMLARLERALPAGDPRVDDLYRLIWGTVHGLTGFVVERVFQLVQTDEERIAAADDAIDLLIDALKSRAAGAPRP